MTAVPHEQMNEQQLADYLHMDLREVRKLASRGQLPCRKVGGEFVFRKGDVDHWVEARMGALDRHRLAKIEKGVRAHHGMAHGEPEVCPLIPDGGIAVPLESKTREAALRGLIALAEDCGVVYNREDLLKEIREREDLCSTALAPGVAMPHPRHPLPYDIAESFLVVGLTSKGIPFGAEDGTLTRLFFLICCKDDRTHLHVLARLARMLHSQAIIDEFLAAETPEELRALLKKEEEALIE